MSKRHFTLAELIKSDTAKKLGIENIPNFEQVSLLQMFVDDCLEPLRKLANRPVYITSGYRCAELNKAIGGVASSYHQIRNGHCAVDISLGSSALNRPFFNILKGSDINVNECFLGRDAAYIHISWHPWKRFREVGEK